MYNLKKEMILFKSTLRNWVREEYDKKNNTVRKVDWNDKRFVLLKLMTFEFQYGEVIIECVETKKLFFRIIQDITFWEDLVIITWKKKSEKEQ